MQRLEKEEGATSRGMRAASRNLRGMEMGSSPETSERSQTSRHGSFTLVTPVWDF